MGLKPITVDIIRDLLIYDRDAGLLFYKRRPASVFNSPRACNSWNSRFALQPALNNLNVHGYRVGRLLNVDVLAHRAIYAIEYGVMPEQIDHIDGNKSNNHFSNLRPTTQAQNSKNANQSVANTSGVTGVVWDECKKKWMARIGVAGKTKFLGYFATVEAAAKARLAAEPIYGYSKRHGELRA